MSAAGAMPSSNDVLLRAYGVSRRFGGLLAVDGVDRVMASGVMASVLVASTIVMSAPPASYRR